MWLEKLKQIWHTPDLRKNIIFVLLMLVVFRAAANIPFPGVNAAALRDLFASNQVFGMLNMFSGGGMQNFSVVMMGVAPYITAAIIFELLPMVIPQLEEMKKEEQGRQKITMWTRWITVPLAALQSFGMITLIQKTSPGVLQNVGLFDMFHMILIITSGTIFLMWIGELITEKNIGNGISLLIFSGIISRVPGAVQQIFVTYDPTKLFTIIMFIIIALVTIVGIVFINEGQRNIPIQHARQIRAGSSLSGGGSYLPLRVNMAGVIPIIFAIAVITFPPMMAQFFVQAQTQWLSAAAQWVNDIFQNQLVYGVLYFLLVFVFTYFYTEVTFDSNKIAENLQKQGAFIPGIRPGKNTSSYLSYITHRITLFGGIFLGAIAVLPLIMKFFTNMQVLTIGGASLLIVVAVTVETVKQIQSQLTMREYDGI
ncbi:MAG TPA: preprotein translocase subunit SecY [Patescibacteria group bacterium]|nr:preprotein translocase subunit SecY [Patescibacteria group bacterium]